MTSSNNIANQYSNIVRQVTKWQQVIVGHRHRSDLAGQRVQRGQQVAVTCVLVFCLVMLLYYNSGSPRSDPQRGTLHRVQLPRDANSEASESGQSPKLCENLRELQVCSHRASLGPTVPGEDRPLIEHFRLLALKGVTCYDIDVVTSSDGKLVVGYPPHVAEELQAAGRPAQPESVPWAEYQAAGLEKQHPLLEDALRAFAGVVQEHAGRQQEREEQQEKKEAAEAAGEGGKEAGGQGAAPSGRRALRQQQQQQQVQQQRDGGAAKEEEGQAGDGEEGAPRDGPMLFVELKGKAMGVEAAQQLAEAARQLGIEQRVGLWFARSAAAPRDTADVYAWLTTAGAGLQRVLSFPDQERLPNGTAAPAAAVVGLSDSASYDMFGPSIKHGEPFLEHLASVGPPLAAWVVDGEEATMRAARVGVSYAISNEPLVVLGRLRDAMEECGGSGAAAVGPGAGVGAGKGLAADGGVEEVGGGAEGMGETKVGMGSERR